MDIGKIGQGFRHESNGMLELIWFAFKEIFRVLFRVLIVGPMFEDLIDQSPGAGAINKITRQRQ